MEDSDRSVALRVAIIGAGAIGRGLATRLASGAVPGAAAAAFLVRDGQRHVLGIPAFDGIEAMLEHGVDIVVEAAGQEAVAAYAEPCLASGCDVVVLSGGALADAALRARLELAARASRRRILLPSGAIGGLDILRAASVDQIDEVVVEQRKPPRVLLDEADASALEEAQVVFDGPVEEVVRLYPRSTNVAAAVALAGLGFGRTRARVVADPAISANVAIVTARGSFGSLSIRLENVPSSNPRTSAIVVDSVVACLRRYLDPLVLPA